MGGYGHYCFLGYDLDAELPWPPKLNNVKNEVQEMNPDIKVVTKIPDVLN